MSVASKNLADVIHEIASTQSNREEKVRSPQTNPLLVGLKSLGTESWIDTGELEKARSIWKKELTALTTNNTLANQVVQTGVMDEVIRETVEIVKKNVPDLTETELVMEIGFVINCKIALRLVQAFDVKVSVELHPSMSRDLERTLYFARRYYKVNPDKFIIKIPLTPEGYLAVRKLSSEGMPINFTLGFSARQNYLAARLSNPLYVNVFLGRLNEVVKKNSFGDGSWVGEKVAWASQNAIRSIKEEFRSTKTGQIGASIRSGDQITTLAGMDVLTIPPGAMKEFLESGRKPEQLTNNSDKELEPGIDANELSRFTVLWEVPGLFKEFVERLVNHPKVDEMSGEDLVDFCKEGGVDLFHRFSKEQLRKIYDHGKIPNIPDWPSTVALDDLMTHSALQSFTKDQDALDDRIRSFLR